MARVQERLAKMHSLVRWRGSGLQGQGQRSSGLQVHQGQRSRGEEEEVTFTSEVVARRKGDADETMVLLRWRPQDM